MIKTRYRECLDTNQKSMENYITKRAEIDAMEGVSKQHFLNKNAQRTNKSLGDLAGITGFGFHLIEVPPQKKSTEFHCHKFEDECVYILSGEAEVIIGEKVYQVSCGDFIGYRANGLPHTMKNSGTEILKCIVVGNRLSHEVVDYPNLDKRLYVNPGQPYELVNISNISNPNVGKK